MFYDRFKVFTRNVRMCISIFGVVFFLFQESINDIKDTVRIILGNVILYA